VLVYGPHKWPVDVVNLHAIANAYPPGFGHPSPKPERLLHWMLSACPGATSIVDPFMGSGTTLRTAKDRCIRAIGIEINEAYCEIAANRLSQGVLFGATP